MRNNKKKECGSAQEQHERIRCIAQQLFEKKGRMPGHDLENWLEAERLVKRECA